MIFISQISWAQLLLIETGAMLQIAALCASIRESSINRHAPHGHDEAEEGHREHDESMTEGRYEPAHPSHREEENYHTETHETMKAGNLLKTAKVHFVQSFKSKKPDQRLHISGHW